MYRSFFSLVQLIPKNGRRLSGDGHDAQRKTPGVTDHSFCKEDELVSTQSRLEGSLSVRCQLSGLSGGVSVSP